MLKNSNYVFWILIFHSCDESTILAVTFPTQTVVGWNASFNMQLDPYPKKDSLITVVKNGTLIMQVKGTQSRDVANRFEFTGNTIENRISFILRNVTLGDAGTYTATESGFPPGGEQTLIVKTSPSKPQIITLTSSVLGSDYRLNCSSVSNSAPPDHGLTMMSEWKVNDQLITTGIGYQVRGTELTITSLTRQDNGVKLACVAYEDSLAKSVPSNEHVIDVKYGPDNVQLNPSNRIIMGIENHPVIIQCTADCNPTCSFQWRRGSVPGYLKYNQTLIIDSVGKIYTDNYTCTVSNGITGRSQSLHTTLVVIYGPASGQVMLSTSDSNQTVEDGTMLNITCSADCYPLCSFIWTGPQGFSQSGTHLSRVVDRNKGGNYICTASNQDNLQKSATASVRIIVMYGPGSSVNLGSNPPTSVNLHQRAPDINCSATCYPPCDYRWYHYRTMYSSGATLSLGVIEKKTSGGNYTCEAYNRFLGLDRSSSISVNITIYYGAEIVSLSVLDSKTVNENLSAIFQCQVDSNPLSTITWKKEGTNTVLKIESGVVQSQFRIESAQCQDTDNYTCSAYNGIRTQANGTLEFFVKCHPRTDSDVPVETKVYKKVHEATILRYTVISYPLPKFTWMFLGNGSESRNLPNSASLHVSGRQSELRFTSLNIDDFGYYSVVADNSLPPSAREVFEIIPADVPEVPSNITITEVTESSITIQWMAGYNGGPKQTFIVFASTGDFTMNITALDPGYENIGTVVMNGLAASTKYSIYMSASNSVGSSNLTEAIFIITLEESRTDTLGNSPIPAVAGGIGAGAMVIFLVLLSIFLWRRYRYSRKHTDEELSERLEKRDRQHSGLVPNPVYDSSESPTSFSINQVAIGAEYSAVVKPKKKVNEKEDQSNLYAQVDKTLTKEKKGIFREKVGKAPKGDIYENAVLAGRNSNPETKYENSKGIAVGMSGESLYEDPGVSSSNIPMVKKDGLLYADLVLNPPASKNGKPIIRGIENCTEYADIAFGKRGEPLPDILDEKEKN
ncbi:hypothetical protein CHS0354_018283 [Potamilus streckersoni]|uniref:Hemicentin-1-like n=1 Tax=Potamilus streckersoni TaxID=2493646 RepID=A0AAE0RLR8_9BIVA|nr:hypothetical protein CHS0354_018283 [Potamilus streckersoni]